MGEGGKEEEDEKKEEEEEEEEEPAATAYCTSPILPPNRALQSRANEQPSRGLKTGPQSHEA